MEDYLLVLVPEEDREKGSLVSEEDQEKGKENKEKGKKNKEKGKEDKDKDKEDDRRESKRSRTSSQRYSSSEWQTMKACKECDGCRTKKGCFNKIQFWFLSPCNPAFQYLSMSITSFFLFGHFFFEKKDE